MSKNSGAVLVTGASGLLGSHLVSLAQKQGREAIGLYHRHPAHIPEVQMLAADLTDQSEVRRTFEEIQPSRVVHCAAATNVDWCERHPDEAQRVNVTVTASIAAITARSGSRLLYISTDSVFDGKRGDYAETDPPAPVNVYAATKLQGEREVLRENPAAAIARVNLYGWSGQKKESLAEWVFNRLAAGEIVPGFSDVIFCPILVNDLAEVLLALLDRNLSGIFHAVGSEAVSKYEFARRVALTSHFDPGQIVSTRIADATLKAQRPLDVSLNTAKICAALGRAMPDVDAGLRRFAHMREHAFADRIHRSVTQVSRTGVSG